MMTGLSGLFQLLLTMLQSYLKFEGAVRDASLEIAAELEKEGVEVLLDDREERPGVKFDVDLIGPCTRLLLARRIFLRMWNSRTGGLGKQN